MSTTAIKLSPFKADQAAEEERSVLLACGKVATIMLFNPNANPMHTVMGYDEDGRGCMWNVDGVGSNPGMQIMGMLPKLDARKLFVCVYLDHARDSIHDSHEDALMCMEKDCLQIIPLEYVAQLP